MKKIITLTFIVLLLCSISIDINACTNILVTKGAAKKNCTMISYSADSHHLFGALYFTPAREHREGEMLRIYEWDTGKYLGEIKQIAKTYSVVGNMNEHQLAIGETTYGGRKELRDPKAIMDYGSLIYVTLQRAKTAREAIKIMGNLVEEHGYYSSGESFSISDKNEVWIMEMISKGKDEKGAVWAAIRIPEGYVSAHANQARIRQIPFEDKKNCYYSKDVVSFAKKKGYFNGEDKDFSFADAYAPLTFGAQRFCEARVWAAYMHVAPKEAKKYLDYAKGIPGSEPLPLWIKPEKKVGLRDVMAIMRDHYEGTELDMTKDVGAGPFKCPYRWRPLTWKVNGKKYFNERAIATQQTGFSFITQSRGEFPNPIGGIFWFGVDDAASSVYIPFYCGINEIPYNFAVGTGSFDEFSWDSAFWVFNWVSNYAYSRYSDMIKDIKVEQDNLEGRFIGKVKEIDKKALYLYKQNPSLAIDCLNKFAKESAELTHKTWKKLGERLIFKYLDGNVKDAGNNVKHPAYPKEWYEKIVKEKGEDLKIIEKEKKE